MKFITFFLIAILTGCSYNPKSSSLKSHSEGEIDVNIIFLQCWGFCNALSTTHDVELKTKIDRKTKKKQ